MTDTMLDLPLAQAERQFLTQTHEVCRAMIVPTRGELDESGAFPEQVFEKFGELGLARAMLAADYDGFGMHPLMPILIAEAVGEYCLGVGTILGASSFTF